MADVQNMHDSREIEIDKVGVKNVKYPIIVLDRANGHQNTIATIDMYVNLPHHYKGTHMSRFVEILHEYKNMINMRNFPDILKEMKMRLNAEAAHMSVAFPYFINKEAPVSKTRATWKPVRVQGFHGRGQHHDGIHRLRLRPHKHALPLFQGDQRTGCP
jgi:GTP cyclohydrolase I